MSREHEESWLEREKNSVKTKNELRENLELTSRNEKNRLGTET